MSTYELEVGEFVPIDEKAGYIQNRSMTVLEYLPVKNGEAPIKDTGMYLRPDEKIKFSIGDNYTAYIRATKVNRYGAEQKANVVVEAAMASENGSSTVIMGDSGCCCCKSGFKEWYSGMATGVGTFVIHDNKIYKCTTPNADLVWNPANWVEISAGSVDTSNITDITQSGNDLVITYKDGTTKTITITGGSGTPYVLPIASASTLGGIKVGTNLYIDSSGVLSADNIKIETYNGEAMPWLDYERSRRFFSDESNTITLPDKIWIDIGGNQFMIGAAKKLRLNDSAHWDDVSVTDYTNLANRAGRDFYIYACREESNTVRFILSANSTYPAKYDATTSRKIGGFHCECADVGTIANHPFSGFMAGDIIPNSIWDLKHRPVSEPEGMVYVDGLDLWIDIYLASWDGEKLVSAYGADIADGDSVKPFHGELFAEEAGKIGKRLLDRDEFIVCAKGSNEQTNIKGSADAVTAGGHVDTNNRRMISNYGLEECCGYMWQWIRNIYMAGLNAASYCPTTSVYSQTATVEGTHSIINFNWLTDGRGTSNIKIDGKQSLYGNCYGALVRLIAGSGWGSGSHCGSRSVAGSSLSSSRSASYGVRLASEPRAV